MLHPNDRPARRRHVDVFARWTTGYVAGCGVWIGGTDPDRHPERLAELLATAAERVSWAQPGNMRVVAVYDDGEG
jgi:hypothetical protein